jgi:photosystem II stability/assembly factor-like uncharacterized protein
MKKLSLIFLLVLTPFTSSFSQSGWFVQTNALTQKIKSISFLNGGFGYALGYNGMLSKTTNYGANWNIGIFSFSTTSYGIKFTDNNHGYIARYDFTGRTNNGGLNWMHYTPSMSNPTFYTVNCISVRRGFSAGCNFVNSMSSYYGCVGFMDSSGYSGGMTILGYNEVFYSISFPDSMTGYFTGGYMSGNNCLLYKSTNAGFNLFSYNNTPAGTPTIRTVYFTNANTGWIAGDNGSIRKTTNGGANWVIQNSGLLVTINSSSFLNSMTGWMCGNSGSIIKTTDGGFHWRIQGSPISGNLNSIQFIDSSRGWIGADNGTLLSTIDGGGLTYIQNPQENIPKEFYLYQNYPNPFNPTSNINFDLPEDGNVIFTICDCLGREVQTLINNEFKPKGRYSVGFNGINLSGGVYFYTLQYNGKYGNNIRETKFMVLVK